jgi:hypothetical protein
MGAIAIGLLGAAAGQAAADVCYQKEQGQFALRLDVRRHGSLTTARELLRFGYRAQTSYQVHGKRAAPDIRRIAAIPSDDAYVVDLMVGTVLTARPDGAWMVVGGSGIGALECISDQVSGTPRSWLCRTVGYNQKIAAPVEETIRLEQVSPTASVLCGAFALPEAGEPEPLPDN